MSEVSLERSGHTGEEIEELLKPEIDPELTKLHSELDEEDLTTGALE
jgi:hypothetical protein